MNCAIISYIIMGILSKGAKKMAEQRAILPDEARLLAERGDGDAALLYLAMQSGASVQMTEQRRKAALRVLAELGLLLPEEHRPEQTEQTTADRLRDGAFQRLVGETQRMMGRVLSTEELKCLITMHDYLRLPSDVLSVLISYCLQRANLRGKPVPSLRTIEKEAYLWADSGVDTMEAAIPYIQSQLARQTRTGHICALLQISGRSLTAAELRYVEGWIDWGFPDDAIAMAYEKTCLNTGGLKWPYLNSILKSWHTQGLHTVKEIKAGDGGAKKQKPADKGLTDLEQKLIRQMMEED